MNNSRGSGETSNCTKDGICIRGFGGIVFRLCEPFPIFAIDILNWLSIFHDSQWFAIRSTYGGQDLSFLTPVTIDIRYDQALSIDTVCRIWFFVCNPLTSYFARHFLCILRRPGVSLGIACFFLSGLSVWTWKNIGPQFFVLVGWFLDIQEHATQELEGGKGYVASENGNGLGTMRSGIGNELDLYKGQVQNRQRDTDQKRILMNICTRFSSFWKRIIIHMHFFLSW